jgi:uncharacterized protein YgbK (DUF1537 family)
VDLDTRAASAARAHDLFAAASASMAPHAPLFLKIDSTLRGPIAAMIDAALTGSGLRRAIVAPAFPEQGRVYIDGILQSTGASLRDVLGQVALRCLIVDDPTAVRADAHPLLVGSAGLARHLAGPACVAPPHAKNGPVLVVAGSPTSVTRDQLERLPSGVSVLRTPPSDDRDTGEAAAALARQAVQQAPPGLLILCGGQTARLVCTALAVERIDLRGEVLPGVPIGQLQGGAWDGVLVVTKAGGFGGPSTLLDVLHAVGPSCLDTA